MMEAVSTKKHMVRILYQRVYGKNYIFQGLVDESLNEDGKPVVYVESIFKQAFGFELPNYTKFMLL